MTLSSSRNVKIATFLNIGFTIVELIGGALTNSLAILTDGLHDLGDSLVLISSWTIEDASHRKPDWERTFGYRRLSLLAAFLNAVILLGGSVVIMVQVVGRLIDPQPVNALGTVWLAIIGISANAVGSFLLGRGKGLNEKVLSWHLLEDVLGWVGILIAGIAMHFTGFYRLDPLITIGFTIFVLWGVWRNSRKLINVFLEGAQSEKPLPIIVKEIESIKGVKDVYDVHLWSLDGGRNLFSMKALIDKNKNHEIIHKAVKKILSKYYIDHSTIELEEEKTHAGEEPEQDFLKT
ncbi:hypothetical protein A2797_01050 [candidate division WWE3 bacterium RIFCSPHIGHO2_01_FULL_48_15]|uniref:Cobalt transporter n=1 Tax=candidate division WWE3 bacterium RIFCSPHIGHO2_01_FULL_48_15 TaxID=1802619 RepID=A0A1F4VEG2_UNCKA|nr:MAG: hypothetical protein A2797_01050 [candidate division WWE3 bacterium RIFCSPHIGHO2_01_FULL_48_15]